MTKYVKLITVLFALVFIVACQPSKDQLVAQQEEMYKTALKYGDAVAARQAIYNILNIAPNKEEYKDTLMRLYYNTGAYRPAILVAEELIESNPEDTVVIEVLAVSRQAVGLLREALEDYEVLYEKKGRLNDLYQIASIQYNLKRYEELNLSIQRLLTDEGIDEEKVIINYPQGQRQQVAMKAAVLNIQGVLAMDIGKYEVAEKSFQLALQADPQFEMAKGNLEALQKQLEASGTGG